MPHFFAITIGSDGGEVVYHADDREQVDHVLGGLGIEIGAEFREGYGRSTSSHAPVTISSGTDPNGLGDRARDAFRELGYEIGVV